MSKEDNEQKILDSWQVNAGSWIDVVQRQAIESRRLVTDKAVLDVILKFKPDSLLDLGCGEGWLLRAVNKADPSISLTGIDGIAGLIEEAKQAGQGQYLQLEYDQISTDTLSQRFDLIVCNFSLLGEASVESLLKRLSALLTDNGRVIIQTLHPLVMCGDLTYENGWREGTWAGIEGDFKAPAPWYFRTVSGWVDLLRNSGLQIEEIQEPVDPRSGKPASIIFVGRNP